MALNRLFTHDEELGKKDDDFRPGSKKNVASDLYGPSHSWILGPRTRRRRFLVVLAVFVLTYLFIHNMPEPLGPVGEMVDIRDPTRTLRGIPVKRPRPDGTQSKGSKGGKSDSQQPVPSGLKSEDVPPNLRGSVKTAEHYYDGVVKFYSLSSSLHAITHTAGYKEDNKNVLFVAASAQSAARLIPVACDMARYDRNYVHFALLGRDPIDLEDLKSLNGADSECSVFWHDGRPDEGQVSTEARMEYSVASALYHIESYMHPQAFLMDVGDNEERYFIKGINSHIIRVGKSLIELPDDATERLMWITRLDHQSLAAWNRIYVDILIHVPPGESGSLIRLLKSIADADYFGARMPHLTIELPPVIEPATQRFLDDFIWPPLPREGGKHDSKVTLRRRVSTAHLTPLEASIRTVESFYSARPQQSHVLLLSTRTEVSPLYYQYLLYNVLEYGYGWYSKGSYEQNHLAGIALDLPTARMDGDAFEPPLRTSVVSSDDSASETAFLWQAPDTNAALYFGSKWQEFHSFLSHRIALPPSEPQQKIVSAAYPAFAEPLQELMRVRNWYIMYPHLPNGNAIVTVHNELAAIPEEYVSLPKPEVLRPKPSKGDAIYMEPAEPPLPLNRYKEKPLLSAPLVALLPSNADLPELFTIPQLSWDGRSMDFDTAMEQAERFANKFRRNIGNCPASDMPEERPNTFSADDLFCARGSSAGDAAAEPAAAGADYQSNEIYAPVRAGLEAAIASVQDQIPNPLQLHPTPVNRQRPADGDDEPQDRPAPEPPNPATPGEVRPGASMQEIFEAERDKARKQMGGGDSPQLVPPKGPGGPGSRPAPYGGDDDTLKPAPVDEEEQNAMQEEFRAHLERLSPEKMQEQVEEKVKKAAAAAAAGGGGDKGASGAKDL